MLLFAFIHTSERWQNILIVVIPVFIMAIIITLISSRPIKRNPEQYHLKKTSNDFERANQILIESSLKENQLNYLKEIIKHIIHQRSLLSRLMLEVQGFETMISKQYRFNSIDFYTIQNRKSNLENQLSDLKLYNEKNRKKFNSHTLRFIDENITILNSVNEITQQLIEAIKNLNNNQFNDLKTQYEYQFQSLIKLNQTLNKYIQQQITD